MNKSKYLWDGFFRDQFVWLETLCEDFDWWFEEIKDIYFSLDYAWLALIPTQHNKNIVYLIDYIYWQEVYLKEQEESDKPEEKILLPFTKQSIIKLKIYYNNLKYWWMPKYDLL